MKFSMTVAAAAMALAAMPATAVQVYSTSYDMINGGGQTSGGSSNYWDRNYSGSGCTTCDGAYLSGGSGDLTDGVVPGQYWYALESPAGTGPYVGWNQVGQANPVITFHFAPGTTVTGLSVFVDNTTFGGVYAPAAILIDGVNTAFSPPTYGTIGWINFTGLNLTGSSHTLELRQYDRLWQFVGEVTFDGSVTAGVPEPAIWALMIAGFGMVGGVQRLTGRARRKLRSAA